MTSEIEDALEAMVSGRDADGTGLRPDLRLIVGLVEPGTRILDIGCGNGDLLSVLRTRRKVDGRGVELSMEGVHACVSRGLSVIQGDADTDLVNYPAEAFDYAILSQTLQAVYDPRGVLENLVRIARYGIVSFPNYGYWRVRMGLMARGRMPLTAGAGHQWWDTPNIRACTVADFTDLCNEMGITIERAIAVLRSGRSVTTRPGGFANFLAEQAVFVLSRRSGG